jgi:membrane protease YdiL (CAAX protease family)
VQNLTPAALAALALELVPAVIFGFAAERAGHVVARWPAVLRIVAPSAFALVYLGVAVSQHIFHWTWFALYAGMPVAMAWLLARAVVADPEQRGNWRDAVILLALGLAVDLRWFDSAWPSGLQALGKILLVDVGLYGFVAIRQLSGTGFDFHLKWSDWTIGLRELALFAPAVLVLGLALGFIHPHANFPGLGVAALRWVGIFFFIAVPEELFFRAWVQNLLERRVGRRMALVIASVLFGLSHFNKRSAHFNSRYVFLATIAGIFYGRAWRERHRVPASTITHTFVDWIWSWWF